MKALLEKLRNGTSQEGGTAPTEGADRDPDQRILFVCMGNICRSPTAEGVFRHIARLEAPDLVLEIDSAGTHAYHIGEPPDPRAQRAAQRRGISLEGQRARRIEPQDFSRFDLLIAMDRLNLTLLQDQSPAEFHERIKLFLEFAPHVGRVEVPDPYYGGSNGFEFVLDLVEDASRGLLRHLCAQRARDD